MQHDKVIEYRMLAADHQRATLSLFADGLSQTTLLQLVGLETGRGRAYSVYAIYREGGMTFEASALLQVPRPSALPEAVLTDLMQDADFLDSMLRPLRLQVDHHFAAHRRSLNGDVQPNQ